MEVPPSLQDALIPSFPPSAYYIPHFITPAEEATLLHHINTAPLPHWRTLSHRRLQAYPSILTPSNTLLDASLPSWLFKPILPRLLSLQLPSTDVNNEEASNGIFSATPHGAPNHCLVNEYLPGQGIYAHEDGNAYAGVVCTVSLGSSIVLDIQEKRSKECEEKGGEGKKWRILQEPRSLLVTTGEVYAKCLHGIEGVMVDESLNAEGVANWDLLGDKGVFEGGKKERGTRVSLTFRDVIKVKKVGKALGGWIK